MKSATFNQQRSPVRASSIHLNLAALIGALALATASALADGNPNPGVAPIKSTPYGKSYSQWAAAYWQWALAIPAANHPLLDETGADADVNQSGPVWFLAGNLGGTSERTVTVPAGKALFFPLLTTIYLGFPCDDRNLPGCEVDQALEAANDIATLLSFVDPAMDGAGLTCEIDGVALQDLESYRARSAAIYAVNLPDDNINAAWGLPGGSYHPCVDVGYYLMLTPLTPGEHTIHFTGEQAGGVFSLNITYHVTVQ